MWMLVFKNQNQIQHFKSSTPGVRDKDQWYVSYYITVLQEAIL